ncbi:beta-ketoacyl-[acyl-carrier-protein] synthase family protein [Nocardia iowensis]|uniref:Beta-ketoacyl-[acyl-carrier-protein] synthase family protein n=1 Tax=Nocardia iowensis TaxID=204891 RepID=A0ABX8RFS4_NOCIO|nr:beta-ketoacyl-[acyl-carrier-protein] synthase family protein [Nocardia iowensis]QXN88463.1 beta-ketoacyl-[acyl-carrier-protein] synthase family protein [Nocardia iowensis]
MDRVVVTGLGPVSSIGIGVADFGRGLRAGRIGTSEIAGFDSTGFPYVHGGEVHGFAPQAMVRRVDPASWGRTSLFAAAAARLAVDDAGLGMGDVARDRIGAVVGTTSGESQVVEALTAQQVAGGFEALDPKLVELVPAARLAHAVSEELDASGPSITITTACSASNYALAYAYEHLCSGSADVMVAGGADSVCRWAHAGFYRMGALAERACSPFDRDRSGILTGEGGAALVLETFEHARARGARIYAEMLGYGLNCDAHHMVAPNQDDIAECVRQAHRSAGVAPGDIDYICAHGTGTRANDLVEARAIRDVFGDRPPPVSSIKSMLGHTMGAASGFGAIASTLAIADGFLPPTVNWRNQDPDMPWLDPVANVARTARVRTVQNNGFAFGGNNAITIFGAMDEVRA